MQVRPSTIAACLALIAVLWTLTLERVSYEQEVAERTAHVHNSNLALALEQQATHTIKTAEQALLFLQYEHESGHHASKAFPAGALSPDGTRESNFFTNLFIVDAEGNALLPDGTPGPVNLSDRDFFRFHAEYAHGGTHISAPVVGRMTGRNVITVSRRLVRPDGSFGGVYAVGLDPAIYVAPFQRIDVGRRGLLQLVGLDGISRTRMASDRPSFGDDMRNSMLLEQAKLASSGTFVSRGKLDSTPRYVSYRTLSEYPLVVAVGTSVDEALATGRGRERVYYAAAGVLSLIIVLAGAGLELAARQRRTARAEALRHEAQLRATFEQDAVGISHASLDGRFIKLNARFCSMFGYPEAELLSRTFLDVTHPEDREKCAAAVRELIASPDGSARQATEKRYIRKDGGVLWASSAVALVRGADGRAEYLIAMVEDITARKQAEMALRDAEAQYRATFEQAGVGITHTDLNGRFIKVNRKFCEMVGYAEAELIGRSFKTFTPVEDRGITTARGRALYTEGGDAPHPDYEKRYRRKDGTLMWARVAVSLVRKGDGAPHFYIAMVRDTTARREAQAKLLEQLDELQRFQRVTVDRELRMEELEAEIARLSDRVPT